MSNVSLKDLAAVLGSNCVGGMAQAVGLTSRPICVQELSRRVKLNWLTQHYDNARTGWNPYESILTINKVKTNFGLLFEQDVTGDPNHPGQQQRVLAQPLYLRAVVIPGKGMHNVVVVASLDNWAYAFDADEKMAPLWARQLTPAGPPPETPAHSYWGIVATPVIDPVSKTLYVVAASMTADGKYYHRLHALDVGTGTERPGSPITIDASSPGTDPSGNPVTLTFDSQPQNNRPGLLLQHGRLYLAFSTYGGFGEGHYPYHGWVLAYDAATLQQVAVFNTSPEHFDPADLQAGGAGIWQSGMGLAADSDGFIYCTTGNGPFTAYQAGGKNFANAVLRLRPDDLTVADYFAPCNEGYLTAIDADLSSGGVMVVSVASALPPEGRTFLVTCGKAGRIYVLDPRNLGRYSGPRPPTANNTPCQDHVVDSHDLYQDIFGSPGGPGGDNGVYGGPAYFVSHAGGRIYYCSKPDVTMPARNLPLAAWHIDSAGKLTIATDRSPETFYRTGPIPVVSSNGPDEGIVWLVQNDPPDDPQNPSPDGTLELYAYDALNLAHQLVHIHAGIWHTTVPNQPPYPVPTVINGKVYVASYGKLMVFG